jgi:hypothetical protein
MDRRHLSTEEFPFSVRQLAHWMLDKYDKAAEARAAIEDVVSASKIVAVPTTFSQI